MNDQVYLELHRLKLRQRMIESKLADMHMLTKEVSDLNEALQRLEAMVKPVAAPPPIYEPAQYVEPIVEPVRPPPMSSAQAQHAVEVPSEARLQVQGVDEAVDAPAQPPATTEPSSLELRVGTYWLVRLGIVMLLTGMVFFGRYAYQNYVVDFGPAGKLAMLYMVSGGLLWVGAWLQRKEENLKQYGQVLFGGGFAAVYFTTYAAHHITALRVIENPITDGLLLLTWAGVMVWTADRRRSEVLAGFGIGLAYYTSAMTPIGWFTLCSNLIMTLAAVVFLIRNRWVVVSFLSLAASYAGYAYWRFYAVGEGSVAVLNANASVLFLLGYWAAFTAAVFLNRGATLTGRQRITLATANNAAFFGLALLTLVSERADTFWQLSLGLGGVLIGLAVAARRFVSGDPLLSDAYLAQGLLLATVGIIGRFSGPQLALILGAQSVLLLYLGIRTENGILRMGSHAAAAISLFAWILQGLGREWGGLVGSAVAVFMLLNAWQWHRQENGREMGRLRPRTSYSTILGICIWVLAVGWHVPPTWRGVLLAAAALALTASVYVVKVKEIAVLGQACLFAGASFWLSGLDGGILPWWNAVAVVLASVGLCHWWQRQEFIVSEKNSSVQLVYAILPVVILNHWLPRFFEPANWMALASLLAFLFAGYAIVTRAWAIAVAGQIFLWMSCWHWGALLWRGTPKWYMALVPVAAMALFSIGAACFSKRDTIPAGDWRAKLQPAVVLYRWMAMSMGVLWTVEYIPWPYRFCFLAIAGALVLAVRWSPDQERVAMGSILTAFGLIAFLLTEPWQDSVSLLNLGALALILCEQGAARRWPDRIPAGPAWHHGMIIGGSAAAWLLVSRWVLLHAAGFYLTVSWAGLALVLFVAGMGLRERMYRWIGLFVLAAAVGRVVILDVWTIEQAYRIVSFMGLGAVLLVLGFIYNKYQEKIREWL